MRANTYDVTVTIYVVSIEDRPNLAQAVERVVDAALRSWAKENYVLVDLTEATIIDQATLPRAA